jgi:hypothetical protein
MTASFQALLEPGILTDDFRGFPQSFQIHSWIVSVMQPRPFPSKSLSLHQSSHCSKLCSVGTDNVAKNHNKQWHPNRIVSVNYLHWIQLVVIVVHRLKMRQTVASGNNLIMCNTCWRTELKMSTLNSGYLGFGSGTRWMFTILCESGWYADGNTFSAPEGSLKDFWSEMEFRSTRIPQNDFVNAVESEIIFLYYRPNRTDEYLALMQSVWKFQVRILAGLRAITIKFNLGRITVYPKSLKSVSECIISLLHIWKPWGGSNPFQRIWSNV